MRHDMQNNQIIVVLILKSLPMKIRKIFISSNELAQFSSPSSPLSHFCMNETLKNPSPKLFNFLLFFTLKSLPPFFSPLSQHHPHHHCAFTRALQLLSSHITRCLHIHYERKLFFFILLFSGLF